MGILHKNDISGGRLGRMAFLVHIYELKLFPRIVSKLFI
jgi:hypothetical protein